jgi:hypothetical protein
MTLTETDKLIRQLIGGDSHAAVAILQRAENSTDPVLLVAAALINSAGPDRLGRAAELAGNTRDRQLVAIAAAYVAGDQDRMDALARDHLVDHPDNLLVAWIAAGTGLLADPHPTHHQEKP